MTRYQHEWEELATLDPFWSILSDPAKQFSKWNVDEFFATGIKEVTAVLDEAPLGYPRNRIRALDFGCGVGRVTRALAEHFSECYGVDISERMISLARQFNDGVKNCRFVLNTSDTLRMFPDDHFDMIYSNIVLQHIPRRRELTSYICELLRVLGRDGLMVFQLPSHVPLRNRIQLRTRLYTLLRKLSVDAGFLYERLGLHPIRMNFIPERDVVALLETKGGRVLDVRRSGESGKSVQSCLYFVTK